MFNEYGEMLTIDDLCEILLIGRNAAYRLLNAKKMSLFYLSVVE